MSRFSERNALRGDEVDLAGAERECFSDPWPGRFFASEMEAPHRYCRVLVDSGGELAAYLFCAWQFLDLHVLKVATRPGFRRQGLAFRLMRSAEEHVLREGGETITLEVRRSNTGAQAFYSSMGYETLGVRPAYYADGEGSIKQYRIDDLELGCLDYLQLDVEGYELKALKGGRFTIDRYSPVIMLESFKHGDDATSFLAELGYRRLVKGVYDQVWVRNDAVDNV